MRDYCDTTKVITVGSKKMVFAVGKEKKVFAVSKKQTGRYSPSVTI